MFKLLDENRDGRVSFNEIKDVLDSLYKILNKDFDKEYELMQLEAMKNDEERLLQEAARLFEKTDEDGSGFIDKSELEQFMREVCAIFEVEPPKAADI